MPSRPSKDEFSTIMAETTRDMTRYERFSSQLIHVKSVASISNLLATTLGRPNALLFGAVCSFAVTLVVYLLSKNLGYSLSGSESIAAFILGWTIGILYDLFPWLFRKKR
jgi:hypothetical protein